LSFFFFPNLLTTGFLQHSNILKLLHQTFVDARVDMRILTALLTSVLTELSQGISIFLNSFESNMLLNPQVDMDITANTDMEDLLAFLGDTLEFVEQDKAFLLDSVFDSWGSLSFGANELVEGFVIAKLRQKPLSANLGK